MPTYEYRCPKCGNEYEKLQRITDQTRAKCPKCGTRGEKMISGGAALVFKGSGFYITDYKRAGESKKPGDESSKTDRAEKSATAEKAEKAEKAAKSERSDKPDKSDKPEKKESKPAPKPTKSSGGES